MTSAKPLSIAAKPRREALQQRLAAMLLHTYLRGPGGGVEEAVGVVPIKVVMALGLLGAGGG